MKMTLELELAREVKALVALAFRNGPIEELHAGSPCPACSGFLSGIWGDKQGVRYDCAGIQPTS